MPISERHEDDGEIRRLMRKPINPLLIAAMAFGLFVGLVYFGADRRPMNVATSQESVTMPTPLEATLGSMDSPAPYLGRTREDCEVYLEMGPWTAEGPSGVKRYLDKRKSLVADGRLFRGTPGASVEVVDQAGDQIQVKLTSGENQGMTGWVFTNWVKPR